MAGLKPKMVILFGDITDYVSKRRKVYRVLLIIFYLVAFLDWVTPFPPPLFVIYSRLA